MVNKESPNLPLCVDMDGTLIKTDMMLEAILYMAKHDIGYLFSCAILIVTKGLAAFKIKLFERAQIDLKSLPYHTNLIAYLLAEKARGRKIILATASSQSIAEKVAAHLGCFDQVIGSGDKINLSGTAKAERLSAEFGEKQYVYAGNAWIDIKVWRAGGGAVVVHGPEKLALAAADVGPVEAVFPRTKSMTRMILKAMRLHQWPKNVLILTPLVLAHKAFDVNLALRSLVGLIAFTILSSSVYILNDLLDLEADRRHPDNCNRPFAAGELPLGAGFILAPLLFLLGAAAATLISKEFFAILMGYYLVTLAYSFRLKQVVLADVLILAALYTWRIFAGSFAINIPISAWFLTFSSFFFLSLALVKRCAELILRKAEDLAPNPRRGYWLSDLGLLVSLGSASGYISVLVLALYINSDQVTALYQRPMVMWLSCPFLLYWLSRMWLKAYRGRMSSDPLIFALKDRTSYAIIAIIGSIWMVASGVV